MAADRAKGVGARIRCRPCARTASAPAVHGIELVADRGSKAPFDPQVHLHARVKREAMGRGLMVYPIAGAADGGSGDNVPLAPPFTIDAIVERLSDAIDAATATRRQEA